MTSGIRKAILKIFLSLEFFHQQQKYSLLSPNHSMNTTLDEDLTNSRLVRYNDIQPDVMRYLYNVISPHYPNLFPKYSTKTHSFDTLNIIDLLHDGEILCRLGQLVKLPSETKNPTARFKSSQMAFIQMENISWFLQLCELLNLPHDEIFQTVDLYEGKDPYQVCITLMSFSRIVNNLDPEIFGEVIGPKKVKVKPVVPNKPRSLRE